MYIYGVELLRQCISRIVQFSPADAAAFYNLFRPAQLKKGTYFAREGRIEREFAFLETGLVRVFFRDQQGQEFNKSFFLPGSFIGAFTSLVSGSENYFYYEALAECRLWTADYAAFTQLFDAHPKIERVARIVAERLFISKDMKEVAVALQDAAARYEAFKQEFPGLQNQIAQYHIASYLGITPTQLSRIRSKRRG